MTKTLSIAEKTRRNKARSVKQTKKEIAILMLSHWTGGIIPALTFCIAHFQAPNLFQTPWLPAAALWLAVVGGLAYSAPTVQEWFCRYVGKIKAWGFVLSLEVAMTFTDHYTAVPALLTLIGINAMVLAKKFKAGCQ